MLPTWFWSVVLLLCTLILGSVYSILVFIVYYLYCSHTGDWFRQSDLVFSFLILFILICSEPFWTRSLLTQNGICSRTVLDTKLIDLCWFVLTVETCHAVCAKYEYLHFLTSTDLTHKRNPWRHTQKDPTGDMRTSMPLSDLTPWKGVESLTMDLKLTGRTNRQSYPQLARTVHGHSKRLNT